MTTPMPRRDVLRALGGAATIGSTVGCLGGSRDPFDDEELNQVYDTLEADGIADNDDSYLKLLVANPHNTKHQILREGFHDSGDISDEDLRRARDPDKDGLITGIEEKIGTDPNHVDTDRDGLFDGWEYHNGVHLKTATEPVRPDGPECCSGGTKIPLPDASPHHKDLFLHIFQIDGTLAEQPAPATPEDADLLNAAEARAALADRFANSAVTNPDGETGIDLHYSLQGDNVEKYRRTYVWREGGLDMGRQTVTHPYWGAYHFMHLHHSPAEGVRGGAWTSHYWSMVEPTMPDLSEYPSRELPYTPHEVADHELVHNISDPHIEYYLDLDGPWLITNDDIAEEVSKYGLLSLPTTAPVQNPRQEYGAGGNFENNFQTWWVPDDPLDAS